MRSSSWRLGDIRAGDPRLMAAVESSNFLLNLQRKLDKLDGAVPGVPVGAGVPEGAGVTTRPVDGRLAGASTRKRKSALSPFAVDRIATEKYPLQAVPVIEMLPGVDTRWLRRGEQFVWK